jgi:hypothetical protein
VQTAGSRGAIAVTFDKRVHPTLDRGRTWQAWHVRPGSSFATPLIGLGFRTYEVGNTLRRRLLRTTDGGRTWQRAPRPARCFSEFPNIDLVTPRLGWLVCGGSATCHFGNQLFPPSRVTYSVPRDSHISPKPFGAKAIPCGYPNSAIPPRTTG